VQIWYVLTVELSCPECGQESLHHSRPRSLAERIRLLLTRRVPWQCHDCGWRGWRRDLTLTPATSTPREVPRDLTEHELERLDRDKP
jgi:predicted RNA-binding Zn-ribbon protein involved in translation (DUF1610 family)